MALRNRGVIEIPDGRDSDFDHGAFDPKTRRVFIAHTARGRIEVIDHDTSRHMATLDGFPEAAGVVAHEGNVLVTNRGAASLAWLDAATLRTRLVFSTAPRPNGVAITASARIAIAACIGDATHGPELHSFDLASGRQHTLKLPGRPRWCVVSADDTRVFLAIREPSMVLSARVVDLGCVEQWPLPSGGAHGMDIDHAGNRLYVACDDGALVEVDTTTGRSGRQWPLDGGPDATFFNPASGLVHVAIAEPGLVQTIDPRTGTVSRIATAKAAKTTALAAPDRLYVISPAHGGVLELAEA
jgi:DNA-binding beta-propeller fold protein YncE